MLKAKNITADHGVYAELPPLTQVFIQTHGLKKPDSDTTKSIALLGARFAPNSKKLSQIDGLYLDNALRLMKENDIPFSADLDVRTYNREFEADGTPNKDMKHDFFNNHIQADAVLMCFLYWSQKKLSDWDKPGIKGQSPMAHCKAAWKKSMLASKARLFFNVTVTYAECVSETDMTEPPTSWLTQEPFRLVSCNNTLKVGNNPCGVLGRKIDFIARQDCKI